MKMKITCLLVLLAISAGFRSMAGNYDFIVAADGSGDFKKVQDAINAVPDYRKNRTTIFIKKGTYKEKLILPGSKTMVTLIGEDVSTTILTFDDYASKKNRFGEELGTTGSSGFFIFGDDFTAENITFENSSGPVGQAVAVRVDGDRAAFFNCRFMGYQDTLYPHGEKSRQYYKNCYIEGTVDFIFGWSTAVFNQCEIFCRSKGYISAASTNEGTSYGFVFVNCKITGGAPPRSVYLGRPWRPYAKTIFAGCYLDEVIQPAGWHNWGKADNEKTASYAEYKNYGPGADPSKRVNWSKQLTVEEAENLTAVKIFGDWKIDSFRVGSVNKIPYDTTFTTYQAWDKIRKEFPQAAIVYPKLPKGVKEIRDVLYCTLPETPYGKRELHLDLFRPEKSGRYPALLLVHGGGWRSGNKSLQVPMAQKIAAKGYVTASIEYRLSPEALYPAAVYDIKAAIRFLRANAAKFGIIADKIAITGSSAGGELAAFMGTTNGNKKFEGNQCNNGVSSSVQAVIDMDGVLDFTDPNESGKDPVPSRRSAGTWWFGASFKENPDRWIEASPITYAGKTTPPMLFINSALPRFHAGRDSLITILDKYRIYTEVHTIENTPHPFWLFHPWFEPTVQYMVHFLDKTLK